MIHQNLMSLSYSIWDEFSSSRRLGFMDLRPGSAWRQLINDEFRHERYSEFIDWDSSDSDESFSLSITLKRNCLSFSSNILMNSSLSFWILNPSMEIGGCISRDPLTPNVSQITYTKSEPLN